MQPNYQQLCVDEITTKGQITAKMELVILACNAERCLNAA